VEFDIEFYLSIPENPYEVVLSIFYRMNISLVIPMAVSGGTFFLEEGKSLPS
jgi:hypothetical protein